MCPDPFVTKLGDASVAGIVPELGEYFAADFVTCVLALFATFTVISRDAVLPSKSFTEYFIVYLPTFFVLTVPDTVTEEVISFPHVSVALTIDIRSILFPIPIVIS